MKLKTEMAVVKNPPMKAAVLREDHGWRGRSRLTRWTPQRYKPRAPTIRSTGIALKVVESSWPPPSGGNGETASRVIMRVHRTATPQGSPDQVSRVARVVD